MSQYARCIWYQTTQHTTRQQCCGLAYNRRLNVFIAQVKISAACDALRRLMRHQVSFALQNITNV